MEHKLINTVDYLLIVDESEIKKGDLWYNASIARIWKVSADNVAMYNQPSNMDRTGLNKIIAHLPLNNSPILEGVDLLPPLEDDVEELAKEYDPFFICLTNFRAGFKAGCIDGFKAGYNKAKDKYKYTEEDIRKAFIKGVSVTGEGYNAEYPANDGLDVEEFFGFRADEYIKSLQQPKMPVGFSTLEQWYNPKTNKAGYSLPEVTGLNDNDGCYMVHSVITNSQGLTQWVGEYIY